MFKIVQDIKYRTDLIFEKLRSKKNAIKINRLEVPFQKYLSSSSQIENQENEGALPIHVVKTGVLR